MPQKMSDFSTVKYKNHPPKATIYLSDVGLFILKINKC